MDRPPDLMEYRHHAACVISRTFLPPSDHSLELRELDRLAPWLAHPAVERILDHERPKHLVTRAAEHIDDEGVLPGVIAAGPPAAEPARSHSGALARPAVQPASSPA